MEGARPARQPIQAQAAKLDAGHKPVMLTHHRTGPSRGAGVGLLKEVELSDGRLGGIAWRIFKEFLLPDVMDHVVSSFGTFPVVNDRATFAVVVKDVKFFHFVGSNLGDIEGIESGVVCFSSEI